MEFLHCMVSSLIDRRKICVGEVVLCFNALKFGARPGPIPASTYPHSYVGSIAVWGQQSDLLSVLLPLDLLQIWILSQGM